MKRPGYKLAIWLQHFIPQIPLTSVAPPRLLAMCMFCLLQHPAGYEASLDPWLQQSISPTSAAPLTAAACHMYALPAAAPVWL
jgi:hypothetical protein